MEEWRPIEDRAIGGRQSSIYACLCGRIKTHMGYTFEYVD